MGCLCSSKNDSQHYLKKSHSLSYINSQDSSPLLSTPNLFSKSFHLHYKLEKTIIGSGLSGQIRLCHQISTNKKYAVKIIPKNSLHQDQLKSNIILSQYRLINELDHPSILKPIDYFEDSSNFFLVMDYFPADDVLSKLQKNGSFSEKNSARIMKQLLSSLAFLHSKKIIHRDVKCENILIEDSQGFPIIKLIDFDTTVKLNSGTCRGKYGTVYYMAPEVIQGAYDEKCDVWSAGVVLFCIITQSFPFGGKCDYAIMNNIVKGQVKFSALASEASEELIDFLKFLLNPCRKSRISADQACCHPWVLKHCKTPVPRFDFSRSSDSDEILKETLKLWVVKNFIPIQELGKYHLMFINLDQDFDGVLREKDIESLKTGPICLPPSVIEKGIEYYEFLSLVLEKSIILKYKEDVFKALNNCSSYLLISLFQENLSQKFSLDLKPEQTTIPYIFSLIIS